MIFWATSERSCTRKTLLEYSDCICNKRQMKWHFIVLILRPVQLINTIFCEDHSSWLLSVKLFVNKQKETPHYHFGQKHGDLIFLQIVLSYSCIFLCIPAAWHFVPSNVKHWIIWWKSHQVKWGGLLRSALRQLWPAEGLVFVGVHQGKDDEEGVVRVLQTRSTNQLGGERSEAAGVFFSFFKKAIIWFIMCIEKNISCMWYKVVFFWNWRFLHVDWNAALDGCVLQETNNISLWMCIYK